MWFPQGKSDPNLCFIAVDSEVGEFWDNAGLQGLKYVFESVKAIAKGTSPPADAKQHAKVSL